MIPGCGTLLTLLSDGPDESELTVPWIFFTPDNANLFLIGAVELLYEELSLGLRDDDEDPFLRLTILIFGGVTLLNFVDVSLVGSRS